MGRVKRYWPLVVLIVVAALAAWAVSHGVRRGDWVPYFMGFFFCQFAMFKLFNPAGFVEGFKMYDLVAKRFSLYGYLYPLIELALGLAFLARLWPIATSLITFVVMSVGAVGVIKALREGLDVRCACMGTLLDVPLSTVTLTEDIAMALMALLSLLR